jgi:hypothetical protein
VKLKALIIASFLIMTSSAFAQWFIQPQMIVTPDAVVARIQNIWGRPVICQGEVHGLTARGLWLRAGFTDVVPFGQFRNAVVVTNPYIDPFIDGRSNLWCNFL